MTITGAIILIFLLISILQPGPPKRKRGRRYSHRGIVTRMPASVAAVAAPAAAPAATEPRAVDPDRADVISALRNLGWSAKDSAVAFDKAAGEGFNEKLKSALAVMSPR